MENEQIYRDQIESGENIYIYIGNSYHWHEAKSEMIEMRNGNKNWASVYMVLGMDGIMELWTIDAGLHEDRIAGAENEDHTV